MENKQIVTPFIRDRCYEEKQGRERGRGQGDFTEDGRGWGGVPGHLSVSKAKEESLKRQKNHQNQKQAAITRFMRYLLAVLNVNVIRPFTISNLK